MIGTSTPEYILIRLGVFGLRAITPISIFYCTSALLLPASLVKALTVPRWLGGYFAVESLFYFLVYLPIRRRCQFEAVHPPLHTPNERRILFQNCMRNLPDADAFLHGWFFGAPLTEIKKDNVKEWIRWGFFNRKEAGLLHEDEVEEYLAGFEQATHRQLHDGNGNARSIRLTFDPVQTQHRPLLWYMIITFVDTMTSAALLFHGFTFHGLSWTRSFSVFPPRMLPSAVLSPSKQLTYFHRPHKSKDHHPILYLHGIGVGLYPYETFLDRLSLKNAAISASTATKSSNGDVGVIAVELQCISSRLTTLTPSPAEILLAIEQILRHHGYTTFVLAANSYGTSITTQILHSPRFASLNKPSSDFTEISRLQIAAVTLIDPIPLLLHLPSVAYNFLHRQPRRANERMLHYFASRDQGVAHVLGRHFFWTENILWKEELEALAIPVCVSLARNDLIVDANTVKDYLLNEGFWASENAENGSANTRSEGEHIEDGVQKWQRGLLQILWFEDCDHASVFDHERYRRVLQRSLLVQSLAKQDTTS